MSDALAFAGSYADFKLVKTRKVAQVVVEIPIERAAEFIRSFGVPDPAQEAPVAIARLNEPKRAPASEPAAATGSKRAFRDLQPSAQAAMTCDRRDFQAYLRVADADAAAREVRRLCGVISRAELDKDDGAAVSWRKLYDAFRATQLAEQHGAL